MEMVVLLTLLQIKHWYADFKIQTHQQAVRKGIWGDPVGVSHGLDHFICTLLALMIYHFMFTLSPFVILSAALIESSIHYHIDWIKIKYGTKDLKSPSFWNQLGIDQMAHHLTYIAMAILIIPK